MAARRPIVAIVGRPNVGKSTLFNRLVGERRAVVNDVPGTTRDRIVGTAEWLDRVFDVVDTGGLDPTAGRRGKAPLSVDSAAFIEEIRRQAAAAVADADVVLFVVDAEAGITPADRQVAEWLRRRGPDAPPVLLVVNKADSDRKAQDVYAFYELGLGDPIPISALHGRGVGDLLDQVLALVPWAPRFDAVEDDDADIPKLAIVGRPNVGKSSLLNRLLGQERVLVSDIPGTTRDAVDTRVRYFGREIVLIDTAGIRRKGRIEPGVEKYSVLRALRALQRADVALLVLDATEGVTAQDAHIGGYIQDAGKSVVLLVNKWDAVPDKDEFTINRYTEHVRRELNFLDYAPLLFISAKTGQRVHKVLPTALEVYEARYTRLPTSFVNRILQEAVDKHPPPPAKGNKALKIYFAAQVGVAPPTFLLQVNDPKLAHFSYLRYLENQIRAAHPFVGTPIRLLLRGKPQKGKKRARGARG